MDQALLTFHNGFPEGVDVFYSSDYCYMVVKRPSCFIIDLFNTEISFSYVLVKHIYFPSQCLFQPLVSVEGDMSNVSTVISTKFTLSLHVDSKTSKFELCR